MRTLRFLAPTGVVLLAFLLAWTASRWDAPSAPLPAPAARPGSAAVDGNPAMAALTLPNPQLEPDEVVRLQVGGLANQDRPSIGILQCYYFASPANLVVTGSLDAFGQLVRRPPYDVLSNPRAILIGQPQIVGRSARVLVTLIDLSGRLHTFVFLLERQIEQPYVDCWMTDSVLSLDDPPEVPLPEFDGIGGHFPKNQLPGWSTFLPGRSRVLHLSQLASRIRVWQTIDNGVSIAVN